MDQGVGGVPGEEAAWWAWFCYERVERDGGRRFGWCKTTHKPYDTLVVAMLLAAKASYGDSIQIDSDGEFDSGWQEGRALYLAATEPRSTTT